MRKDIRIPYSIGTRTEYKRKFSLNQTMNKSISIRFFMLGVAFFFATEASSQSLLLSVDGLAPALKIGYDWPSSERLHWRASAGFCLVGPSLLSYNFYGLYRLSPPMKKIGFNLIFGLIDNYVELLSPTFSLGIGVGAGVYFQFTNRLKISLRAGAITGPSLDTGKLNLLTLPNFGIDFTWRLKPRRIPG